MKKLLFIFALGCLLIGCRSDIDLGNVDTRAQLEMGLGVPLGNFKVTLSDFLGEIDKVYVDGEGIITYRDTFSAGRSFHEVNLAERISTDTFDTPLSSMFEGLPLIGGMITIPEIFGDIKKELVFEMPIELTGFNDDLSNERLDSVWIENSSFSTQLITENFGLDMNWIDSIVLDLGGQIRSDNGDTSKVIFKKGTGDVEITTSNSETSSIINTKIDHFTLDLIKDHSRKNPAGNVLKGTKFKAHVYVTFPAGCSFAFSTASRLRYRLSVNFITFKAIWGYFKPSDEMSVEDIMEFGDSWKSIGFLQNSHMPFSNPQIKVDIKTQIAGNMDITDCYLFSVDTLGKRTYAMFGPNPTDTLLSPVQLFGKPLDTDPKVSPLGTFCERYAVFDRTQELGQIDRLFGSIPDKMSYKFNVDFNVQYSPYQARLTPNDSIHIDVIANLPMTFRDGFEFHFNDTTEEMNLSGFTIDSLLNSMLKVDTIQSSNLKVYMTAVNEMPFSMSLVIRCLDANGDVIMDPDSTTSPFNLFGQDTVRIEAADFDIEKWTDAYGKYHETWHKTKDTETLMIADLDKKRMDILPQIKKIVYLSALDDQSTKKMHEEGYKDLQLKSTYSAILKVGIAADIKAIVDLAGIKDNKENNNQ